MSDKKDKDIEMEVLDDADLDCVNGGVQHGGFIDNILKIIGKKEDENTQHKCPYGKLRHGILEF